MTQLNALWPTPQEDLTDEQILQAYEPPTDGWLRMNFISSLDGAATRDGRAGGLGDSADRRVFELLRWWADVVLLGAGTARDEGYSAMRLPDEAARWRVARHLNDQPVFALVTKHLDLNPRSDIFAGAPVTPLVFTTADAPISRRESLAEVAEVITAGRSTVDPSAVRDHLSARGLTRIHAEGGPTLLGSFIAAGTVDELCLTLAPTLEAGQAPRISHAPEAVPTAMKLAGIMRSGNELLLRYTRTRSQAS